MISLVLIVISISLFATLLTIGSSSVNLDSMRSGAYENEFKLIMPSIETAIVNYRMVYGAIPDGENWRTQVFPDFGIYPEPSAKGDFSLEMNGGEWYLCYTGTNFPALLSAFSRIIESHSGQYLLGVECGSSELITNQDNLVLSYRI